MHFICYLRNPLPGYAHGIGDLLLGGGRVLADEAGDGGAAVNPVALAAVLVAAGAVVIRDSRL